MISLIICSRTATLNKELIANIESTIGCLFEFILIDNSENRYNIFEAYNLGVTQSKGDILCFMHDDILFHTRNWGEKVGEHLKDEKIGAIGIAGSPYTTKALGTWWGGGLINQHIVNGKLDLISRYADKVEAKQKEVIVLDGVWFCIKRNIFTQISFDEINFTGFHFYDIDIALQVYQVGYRLLTVYDILIEHDSQGSLNIQWLENAKAFNQKWKRLLPLSSGKISFAKACTAELRTINELTIIEIGNGRPVKEAYLDAIKRLLADKRLYLFYRSPKYLRYFLHNYLKA